MRVIPPSEYSYPHGQCRSVGVAGYLLGGGVNWLGTYNKFGYGAESVLSMRVVLADGSIAAVSPDKTAIEFPQARTILHTENNNLFFALRGAGSSYAVITEFLYIIHHTPETLPAILLAWADNQDDLDAIQVSFIIFMLFDKWLLSEGGSGLRQLQCDHQSGVHPHILAEWADNKHLQRPLPPNHGSHQEHWAAAGRGGQLPCVPDCHRH